MPGESVTAPPKTDQAGLSAVPAGLGGVYRIVMAATAIGIMAVFLLNISTPLEYVRELIARIFQGGPWRVTFSIAVRLVALVVFTLTASAPIILVLRIYLKPLMACLAAWRAGRLPRENSLILARRRTLNLPFVFIPLALASGLVFSSVGTGLFYLLGYVDLGSALALVARSSMVGLVSAAAAFFWLETHCRRRYLPLLFPRGRLTRVRGAARLSISRRIRAVNRISGAVPLVILLVTLVTLQWEVEQTAISAKDYGRGILIFALVLSATFFLLGGLINRQVAGSITRPLRNMLELVGRVNHGDYQAQARVVSNDEIGELGDAGNTMIRGLGERELLRDTLGKYVTPQVRDEILSGRVPLDGETKLVTVLFADLRGFTPLVAATPAKELVAVINGYFEAMAACIQEQGGLVLQYIGDEIEAVFGAPVAMEGHCDAAARAALAMRAALAEYNRELERRGRKPLAHGIGICTGEVLAANIGSPQRLSYALLGDTVNMASRMQELTKQIACDTLISAATAQGLTGDYKLEKLPPTPVRGAAKPLELYALLG